MEDTIKKPNTFKKWIMPIGSLLLFLGSKLKWLLVALKVAKFGTLISMIISVWVYAVFYGWKFAVALVYLIYVHEMGHLLASRQKGIPTSKAIFIPFVGALIAMKEQPKHAKDEAYIAYAGPLLGTIAFLPAIPLYYATQEPFWGLVIFLGALINLFNLIPVHPLDGGRIVTIISTKFWMLGILLMIVYVFFNPNPIVFLILLFGISKLWSQIRQELKHKKITIKNELFEKAIKLLNMYQTLSERERDEIIDTWIKEEEFWEEELSKGRKHFIPFVEDNKILERYRIQEWKSLLEDMLDPFTTEEDDEAEEVVLNTENDPDLVMEENRLAIEKMTVYKKEISKNRDIMESEFRYYQASGKTKALWFALYLLLAVILFAFTMYGSEIMEQHKGALIKP